MRQIVPVLFWLVFFCICSKTIFADNYYVNAYYGDDLADGKSKATAWRSLARASQHRYHPGDSLLLHAAQIHEGILKVKGSGIKSKTITLSRYGSGDNPLLQGNGQASATLHLQNVDGWEIKSIKVSNYGAARAAGRTGIWWELKDYGEASYARIDSVEVCDVNGSLVKKEGGGAGIIFSNSGEVKPSRFLEIVITNNTIKRTERNGILINGNWSRDAWFPNKNVLVSNNHLEGVPGDGIVPIGCDGALIEYNVMRDCPRLLPDTEAAAGIWPWSCDNTIIQYNEVSDHKAPWDAQGFDSDWNCRNTIIQYNYSHDNEGGFLLICNDGNVGSPNSVGNTGTIVRYNISVNDGRRLKGKHAGFSPIIHIPGPVRNTAIYNNLIVVPAERPKDSDSTVIAFDNWGGYADSTLITQNIFCALSPVDYVAAEATAISYSDNAYLGIHLNPPEDKGTVRLESILESLDRVEHPGRKVLDDIRSSKDSLATLRNNSFN
ncbi:right-handed parallel beta-helix repeat-containing protein [Olivibacter sp. SDN3]|uniref:right-handed parallel beta-helix repeat-containing protein n=1 Tax=Olivibacter sp. SDN3 TaxID=2764720 RepID=UPI00165141FD|nr:right-handed parallel beta-helix repeat-containing protein [Olivibacter sp. SDN3]QNL48045.1 right-handed parallel beta-helix repeat-containing protein [Olivibacter sp. SDN3]